MGVIGDQAISPGNLARRVRELERQVQMLTAGRRLEAASIGRGGLTVTGGTITTRDTDGNVLSRQGQLAEGWRGTWIGRAGGGVAFFVGGEGADEGFVGIYDRAGQYIVSDDAASERGLARPYIPIQTGEVTVPTATTASATFVDMAAGTMPVQHPVLHAHLLIRSDDGSTTGEVRMTLDGEQVGEVLEVAASQYAFATLGPAALPGVYPYGALRTVAVQARRTAGSGNIGVRVLTILGLESAYLAE
ncbi:hypothetical protein [Verrucosispora sp. WMMD1129]|uniref:hypothetical protein n=1 Tax=Verrucosispora sp. WMMD1129 TaxID=3016093 RepID=UPI00249B3C3D|nr:hypothetical protein [Verrucosispora sp. WMMD1129]WFE45004.1 hypothetical protein O7624_11975 [Verrucosispora sp. WMMD1129]WFE46286.1 hypothetical protein O7624_19010 [Verrucosispora sp. WMMD1129]